mgnify:CR=1 FL=1
MSVDYIPGPQIVGQPATGTIVLGFAQPLPPSRLPSPRRHRPSMKRSLPPVLLALCLLAIGCQAPEDVRRGIVYGSPYERYTNALQEAGLVQTALGQAWQTAGDDALARLDEIALEHGCRAVRLDTSDYLTPAVGLYRSAGYRAVPAYNENPKADLWFERRL